MLVDEFTEHTCDYEPPLLVPCLACRRVDRLAHLWKRYMETWDLLLLVGGAAEFGVASVVYASPSAGVMRAAKAAFDESGPYWGHPVHVLLASALGEVPELR